MNGLLALAIILVVYAIGDMVATKTNAVISMLFVASIIFATMFWLGAPKTIFQDSALQAFASVTVGFFLVHIGTTIFLKDLIREWKTVVLVLCSTIAICLTVFFVGRLIIDKFQALMAAPIVGGGVVAFLVMSDVLKSHGTEILAFGSIVLVLQGVIGFPIASALCKKEAFRLKKLIESDDIKLGAKTSKENTRPRFRFIPQVKEEYNSGNYMLAKLGLTALLSSYLSNLTGGRINTLVICLLLGVLGREIGFLDEGSLSKANGFTWVIGAVLTNVFASLANTTPSMFLTMLKPLIVVFIVGIATCAFVSVIIGKLLGESWYMSFAMGITALFGFPGTFIVPNEVSKAVGSNKIETEIIMQNLMPKMVIAGMVSVSIVSVVFAGVMAGWA